MIIIWSQLAEKSYYSNLEYLNENWSRTVAQDFILKVEKVMDLISNNPDMFRWWDEKKEFKIGYITSHISFFYSFDQERIFIHLFWDKRRDPEKLRELLK